jgi:hypothetical protein
MRAFETAEERQNRSDLLPVVNGAKQIKCVMMVGEMFVQHCCDLRLQNFTK